MTVRIPKTRPSNLSGASTVEKPATLTQAKPAAARPPKQKDAMASAQAAPKSERYVAPQGNSLIERTQRYLAKEIGRAEAKLAPVVAELSKNGWFSASTLKSIEKASTPAAIADLIRASPGAASLGTNTNIDAVAAEILRSPAKASTVLLMSTSGAALQSHAGAREPLQEVVYAHRHLDNLETYVGYGFKSYASLEQLQTELTQSQKSAVDGLAARLAPLTLADVQKAQAAFQNTGGTADRKLAEKQREGVLEEFTAQVKAKLPAPLWKELNAEGGKETAGRLENLLQRGPYGPDYEQARNVVSLFMTKRGEWRGAAQALRQGAEARDVHHRRLHPRQGGARG